MPKVKISTSFGDIVVRLYDETPLHRDNFLKLVREGFYDGLLFHRVIKDFMIQGGDPGSKGAPKSKPLGAGDVGYTIPAEFNPGLFHKRGALAAARQGDEVNPERRSSGCQFSIVWGKTYSQGEMGQMEKQLEIQALNQAFEGLVRERRDEIMQMRRDRDQAGLYALQEDLEKKARAMVKEQGGAKMDPARKEVYSTLGGTPFLDGQYTVFGEVESGLGVGAKIQSVSTDGNDRPAKDVGMKAIVTD